MTDRAFLFEKYLDNLELYLDYKRDLNEKIRAAYANENYEVAEHFWSEYEHLEILRELVRRALDEYCVTAPATQDSAGASGGFSSGRSEEAQDRA